MSTILQHTLYAGLAPIILGFRGLFIAGLPIAVKDLTAVKGLPFTQGSLLFKDRIAQYDDPLVQRLEEKGAIIVGRAPY